ATYYMKAMNCPHHHIIYRHKPHSYRELPIRLAEYGTVYRNERSGTLAGLLRVRALAMNDAHIYCRKDQIKDEFKRVMHLTMRYFEIFGLENYWFRLSKWSPEHLDKYINEPENWEYSQNVLREVLVEMHVPFKEAENEAAFYGPKVDVMFKSVIGREETMSTIQLDFLAKQRFGLSYTDETGQKNNEVFVVHRAPLSTHERFMAFLIEHYAGAFPLWLAPVQVGILSVADRHVEFARSLAKELSEHGLRVGIDDSTESVGKKIREAEKQKYPRMLVVGDKEVGGGELTVRVRGEADQKMMTKEAFLEETLRWIKQRTS
ncbi:threonine--tRNA ligase, partial [Candidatus Uhrbacteria bacterium]|nr:threonine--tRNA ligase [Candidatus Uhrbacteria bacterium]